MDFDNILTKIGGFGKYQKTRFLLFCLPAVTIICFGAFVMIFNLKTPHHRCAYPRNLPTIWPNGSEIDKSVYAEIFTPPKDNIRNYEFRCTIYDYSEFVIGQNWSHVTGRTMMEIFSQSADRTGRNTTSCASGMWYDHDEWDENIVMRHNLVCDRAPLISTIYSMTNAGGIIGMLLLATLQDRFGRKKTFFLAIGWYIVSSLCSTMMPNWWSYAICVFLKSFCISSCFQIPWLISLELVGPSRHTTVLVFMCICFSGSCVLLAIVAYFARTWIQLTLITTLPAVLLFGYVTYVDESGRWLLATGRITEAKKLIRKIAKINGADISTNSLDAITETTARKLSVASSRRGSDYPSGNRRVSELLKERELGVIQEEEKRLDRGNSQLATSGNEDNVVQYGFWSLFTSLNLLAKTLIISVIISANMIVYSGFNLNIENLGYNQYITFGVTSLVEIPAAFACYMTAYIGKLTPTALSMILAGLFSMGSGALETDNLEGIIACAVMTKLFITFSFDLIYLVAGESFPTVVRASGMGVTSILASLFNIATPFIVGSAYTIHRSMPMYIFGSISIFAGLLGLFLPEMSGVHLLDSLEQEKPYKVGFRSWLKNITWYYARMRNRQKASDNTFHDDSEKYPPGTVGASMTNAIV